jgi:hypothetical protein
MERGRRSVPDIRKISDARRARMRNTPRDDETADSRSAAASTLPPSMGSRATFIRYLLRFARLRWRKEVTREHVDEATSPQARTPYQASDAARSSMDAGITKGSSLLFGRFSSRR